MKRHAIGEEPASGKTRDQKVQRELQQQAVAAALVCVGCVLFCVFVPVLLAVLCLLGKICLGIELN